MESTKFQRVIYFLKKLLSRSLLMAWLVGVAMLIIGSLIPDASFTEPDAGFGIDKIFRLLAFGLLSFYPVAYFFSIKRGLIMASFVAPLGFLLEVAQKYIPGRDFSPEDMIANNIGAIIGIVFAVAIRTFFYTGRAKRLQGQQRKQENNE